MTFQEFSKNYLNISMESLLKNLFVPSSPIEPVICCLNLNETLLPRKLSIVPATVQAGSSLQYSTS